MINNTRYKIAKKYEPMIREVYEDSDGIWVDLKPEYIDDDMRTSGLHVDNGRELRSALTNIRRRTAEEMK